MAEPNLSDQTTPDGSKGQQTPQVILPDPAKRTDYGEYDENGVDVSLLRYMLQLTPLERLTVMERHARDTQLLYEYGRKHRESQAAKLREEK